MRSPYLVPAFLLASTVLALPPAGAQRPISAGVRAAPLAAAPLAAAPLAAAPLAAAPVAPRYAPPVPSVPAARRPAAWPYVLGGAVLGGAVMAGGLALALQHGESLTPPVAYVPAVAGAAALGAGGGYLVYRLRF